MAPIRGHRPPREEDSSFPHTARKFCARLCRKHILHGTKQVSLIGVDLQAYQLSNFRHHFDPQGVLASYYLNLAADLHQG